MAADPVVLQVYVRSFQDSDGDGVGDLPGVTARLDHLVRLGVDALWLSPIHPSPLHDFGYDISDYLAVDPALGTFEDLDALIGGAHERGLKVLMDLVACHTSVEHPWFSEHPDWYVWSDAPNNWRSAFGGPAWTRRGERWYLHSFYPEQADLDWRNPEVVEAMQGVIGFWLERGVDGFRLDAIDRLMKDPELRDDPPAVEAFGLPVPEDSLALALSNSRNAPDIGTALAAIRAAAGEALLVGEVYLPGPRLAPYLEHLDAVFAFELLHARWEAPELGAAIAAMPRRGAAWVLSNHDFGRLTTRFGQHNARAAALLLLTLPGWAFLYQGDELGLGEGPGGERVYDRAGRDRHRHPMQWDASPSGGFSGGRPWLAPVDPAERNVQAQSGDSASMLSFVRALVALRDELGEGLEVLEAAGDLLLLARGDHTVAVNTGPRALALPGGGDPVLESEPGAAAGGRLAAHAGAILS
jgi:alpha-glucosidase